MAAMTTPSVSLQEQWAPRNRCFGCGPANEAGLRIRSFPDGEDVVCRWTPQERHEAFSGFLNGGVIGALFDCHGNWTAIHHWMKSQGLAEAPCSVTSELHVSFKRPTPSRGELLLRARVNEAKADRAVVEGSMQAGGEVTATFRATNVVVREGHPAFHRW